jgi:hypothetical protein
MLTVPVGASSSKTLSTPFVMHAVPLFTYMPEGRVFESNEVIEYFSIYLIFPAALGSGVYLGIETVTDIITRLASSRNKRLQNHINSEVSRLLNVQNIPRRLKRNKPFELVKQQTTK